MYGLESPTCIYTEQKNNIKTQGARIVGVCGQRLPCLSWFQALERKDMNKHKKYKKKLARIVGVSGVLTAVVTVIVV